MIVNLTEGQALQLQPLFADVNRAAKLGLHGMLVAQVYRDPDGVPRMQVGFIRHEQAKLLTLTASEKLPETVTAEQK